MSRARLSQMKPTAVLINVSRGAIIDEGALVDMLSGRLIRGAALDVFENEPLPPGHPLWSLDNVLISPHTADHTSDSHLRSTALFIENLRRFERGDPLRNVVDKRERY
jgi:phosphoglycerate dehydrogenase-like enzyme